MATINLGELDKLERRERQLTILAAVVVVVEAAGVALLMYPLVFVHPDEAEKLPLRFAFFGFCVLSLLVAAYLLDRQRTFRNLKQQLVSELQRNIDLQNQANADLLHTIPDLNHFQDRLAMDFRRAATMEKNLSVMVVKVFVSSASGDQNKERAAIGEAARAIARLLRPTDSMYLLGPGYFGLVLSDTDTTTAKQLASQISLALKPVAASNQFTYETFIANFPDDAKSAHELEQSVFAQLPANQSWLEESAEVH
jgi:GGDEF domain-containing protein